MALLAVDGSMPADASQAGSLMPTTLGSFGQLGRASGEIGPEVVAAARRGDAHAFEAILRHYDRRLRVIADRLLGGRQLMDDALQEVAIKTLRGLPSFRGEAPLGAWLCRIATTTCLDMLRRQRPEDATAPDDLPERREAMADPADGLDARQRLGRVLAELPPDQRVAVLLIDQFGYDFRAAADAIGVPVGTVASRVATARSRLRAALAAEGREER
ncbi:MAG TPA: sigma-70 family RNA polymerase sigma factor [Thermoleophilia bacterium]|nr:sigma-70 family RNA polymerase sigma factor [Thermoleophilia bacterium]